MGEHICVKGKELVLTFPLFELYMWFLFTSGSSFLTDLHDKLAGVCSSHGGALTSCKDPHGPYVESSWAKETAEHHSLLQTRKHRRQWIKNRKHALQNQHRPTLLPLKPERELRINAC